MKIDFNQLFVLLLFLGMLPAAFAQTPPKGAKSMDIKRFRFTKEGDSIPLINKSFSYREDGALLRKAIYTYQQSQAGALAKEEWANFDSSTMILSERIVHYTRDGTEQEGLKTKYLVYQPTEENSKHIWRQYTDRRGELMKEDTLSYDARNRLIKQCVYNYKGNTSLYCEHFKYNKKNKLKRWKVYYHWMTVGRNSSIKKKAELRKIHCLKYYADGRPKKIRGKVYSSKIYQDWEYDKNKQLSKYIQRRVRKGKKKETVETRIEKTYDAGKLTSNAQIYKGEVKKKEVLRYYKDSLLSSKEYFNKKTKIKREEFFYNDNDILTEKQTHVYSSSGKLSYILHTTYNDQGLKIKEEQKKKDMILTSNTFEYNERGDKISETMFLKNDQKFEKTTYFYEYY